MLEKQVDVSREVQHAVRYLLRGLYLLLSVKWFGRRGRIHARYEGYKAHFQQAWITARKDDTLRHGLVSVRCECRVIRLAHLTKCTRYRQTGDRIIWL